MDFLNCRDAGGRRIATGDLIQSVHGDRVSSQLVFRFLDGSVDDERSVFTQHGGFHLLHDRRVQKGASFPHPSDIEIDVPRQEVTIRSAKNGEMVKETAHEEMPPDLSNGLPLVLVKNVEREGPPVKVHYLAATPKPRMVELQISPGEEKLFSVGLMHYKAACFIFHPELGGLAGVLAPILGKQPADSRVWVIEGRGPSFIRAELPFYVGGPVWTIAMTAPVWPK